MNYLAVPYRSIPRISLTVVARMNSYHSFSSFPIPLHLTHSDKELPFDRWLRLLVQRGLYQVFCTTVAKCLSNEYH